MITSATETHEGRFVDAIKITVAYLYTESYKELFMILKGILEEVLVNIYTNLYIKYVILYKGEKLPYVKLQKSLYRLLSSALLFYLKSATNF